MLKQRNFLGAVGQMGHQYNNANCENIASIALIYDDVLVFAFHFILVNLSIRLAHLNRLPRWLDSPKNTLFFEQITKVPFRRSFQRFFEIVVNKVG
ncbi:MAG: hypothetical protein F6J87_10305 [Spirulina sp. SIO3F2]|nr:hypothetical protein [Spirulina sp. SIO3F2]